MALLSHPECLDRGLPQYRQNLVLSLSLFFFFFLFIAVIFQEKGSTCAGEIPHPQCCYFTVFLSASCDLFTININRCCEVSTKQLQCISCYSVDLSWWTSVLGMYFQDKVYIFYGHILYSL